MAYHSALVVALLASLASVVVVSASSSSEQTGDCDPSSLLQTTLELDKIEGIPGSPALNSLEIDSGKLLQSLWNELKDLDPSNSSESSKSANSSTSANGLNSSNSSNGSEKNHSAPSAAEATGVTTNQEGDLQVLLVALGTNSGISLACVIFFMVIRHHFSNVYEANINTNIAPQVQCSKGPFDWITRSLRVDTNQIQDTVGLDMAMSLEFMQMGMNIMAIVSIPIICIEAPLNLFCGGNAAGEDHLSWLSIGNVQDGSWLYWVYSAEVWLVVLIVQVSIYRSMDRFLDQRERWLRELPAFRANTILVEEIPLQYRSDKALKAYFEDIFGRNTVEYAATVKVVPELRELLEKKTGLQRDRNEAREKLRQGDILQQREMDTYQDLIEIADKQLDKKREEMQVVYAQPGGKNTSTGFVRFYKRVHALLAAGALYSSDIDEWNVSMPPPPQSILWDQLAQRSEAKTVKVVIGYGLVACLYAVYLPIIIWISKLANSFDLGFLQPLWDGFAPTLGLTLMVSFTPSILVLIFDSLFTLPDSMLVQEMLQKWYFAFQVVFVLIVTAIGPDVMDFLKTLIESPLDIFLLLGSTMPSATHFYMNFLVLQWTTHFMVLTRYVQLAKYILYKYLLKYPNPKELSEPEDQDYYGIGSRSARWTITLCIGIVYGTLSPPIVLLTFLTFAFMRLIYGYLLCFAENPKEDLGGVFYVHMLMETFTGNAIYVVTMTGVLLGRADTKVPGVIAGVSLLYVAWSYRRFMHKYTWEDPPVHEMASQTDLEARQRNRAKHPTIAEVAYMQPEFVDDAEDKYRQIALGDLRPFQRRMLGKVRDPDSDQPSLLESIGLQ